MHADDLVDTPAMFTEVPPEHWDARLIELGLTDAYLLHPYVEASALLETGTPVLLHMRGSGGHVVMAALVREIPTAAGLYDVVTPYGYGGPITVGDDPPIDAFHEGYRAWAHDRGVVTTFLRFHPLYANHLLAPDSCDVTLLSGTVAWDLSGDRDLLASMHKKHRNMVHKAQGAGVRVRMTDTPTLADINRFAQLYEVTMRRLDASGFYFFAREYWSALANTLADRIVVHEAVLDGAVIAATMCLATRPFLHYHLGATGDDARDLGASNLLLWEAARWAQDQGFTRFHLGGGVGGADDGLLAFKRRFDPNGLVASAIGKQIDDPDRYRAMTGRSDTNGFFPAYRGHD